MSDRIFIVIPAFNEEEPLPTVLEGLHSTSCEIESIIVVDSNSTDRTAEVARKAGAEVVKEMVSGYGAACLTGVAVIREKWQPEPSDIIVFIDGDGSDFPDDIIDILKPIQDGNAEFVVGSRLINKMSASAVDPIPRLGNRFSAWVIKSLYGLEFTDLGPFRAIRFDAYESLGMKDMNWGWTVEMQLLAGERGLKVAEVPVRYRRRLAGESKISGSIKGALRASVKILYVLALFTVGKLFSGSSAKA